VLRPSRVPHHQKKGRHGSLSTFLAPAQQSLRYPSANAVASHFSSFVPYIFALTFPGGGVYFLPPQEKLEDRSVYGIIFKAPPVCKLHLTTRRNPQHLPVAVGLTIIKLQAPLIEDSLTSVFASFLALQLLSFPPFQRPFSVPFIVRLWRAVG